MRSTKKCLGNSTKLYAIINRLVPEREKLAQFNQAVFSVGSIQIPLAVWDHKLLMKYWGKLSKYLHWAGAIDKTVEDVLWVEAGIAATEEACSYILGNLTQKESGGMIPDEMHPEIRRLWEIFRENRISTEEVKISSQLLEPAIR